MQRTMVLYVDAYLREVKDYVAAAKQADGKLGYCIHGDQVRFRDLFFCRILLSYASSTRRRGEKLSTFKMHS
jgi:hypothetical protein